MIRMSKAQKNNFYGIDPEIAMAYEKRLLKHLSYVHIAGIWTNTPQEQLAIHDESKWSLEEFPAYAMKFCSQQKSEQIDDDFTKAWLHHENFNPHHWGHWIVRTGRLSGTALAMPENYVREMVADWMGAEKAYQGQWIMTEWLNKNVQTMNLHEKTRKIIDAVLVELDYKIVLGQYSYESQRNLI